MQLQVDSEHPDANGPLAAYLSFEDPDVTSYGNLELVPSFAGVEVQQPEGTTTMFMGEGTDSVFIRNSAGIGESWSATSLVTATVDSFRQEVFTTFTDSVKCISFSLTSTGCLVSSSIRISQAA